MTNQNSIFYAGGNLKISGNDLNIKGGNITGDKLDINVNNLDLESVQDPSNSNGYGFNLSMGTTGKMGGGININDDNKKWVSNQTTLIGKAGSTINVSDNTNIVGAVIGGENTILNTGSLTYSNMEDTDKGKKYRSRSKWLNTRQ